VALLVHEHSGLDDTMVFALWLKFKRILLIKPGVIRPVCSLPVVKALPSFAAQLPMQIYSLTFLVSLFRATVKDYGILQMYWKWGA